MEIGSQLLLLRRYFLILCDIIYIRMNKNRKSIDNIQLICSLRSEAISLNFAKKWTYKLTHIAQVTNISLNLTSIILIRKEIMTENTLIT